MSKPLDGQPIRILLVEDSRSDAALLNAVLLEGQQARFSVDVAVTLQEAMERIAARNVDVVLLDLALPDSFGPDTLSQVVAADPALPVIILTGLYSEYLARDAVKQGAQDYLLKNDLGMRGVWRVIDHAIARKKNSEALRHAHQELEQKALERAAELSTALEALRDSQDRLHQVVHHAPIAIWAIDVAGTLTLVEGRLLPLGASDLCVGRPMAAAFAVLPDLVQAAQRALGGEDVFLEVQHQGLVYSTWHSPIRDGSGAILGALCVCTDKTDQKRAEQQFVQAQKMEVIGMLAGGIAHDFRNQLTVIKGYSEMLLRQNLVQPQALPYVQHVLKAVEQSTIFTGQLLSFSRQEVLRPETVDLAEVACRMEQTLAKMVGEDIHLTIRSAPALPGVRLDANQFQQAVLNLALNARDAMPDGGDLLIDLDTRAGAECECVPSPVGQYVRLRIRDTGAGMDEATLRRAGEPFFTTKPAGHGTGLGLSMVADMVKDSGGTMKIDSRLGSGTTVRLCFPACAAATPADPIPASAQLAPRGQGHVLVVEDEDDLRQYVTELLAGGGFTVAQAKDAAEALALGLPQVNLLITDIVMRGMNGLDLARRLRQARPGLGVVFMSGYAHKVLLSGRLDEPWSVFLSKPFGARELWLALEQVKRQIGQAEEACP